MEFIKSINVGLRFILEICVLVAVGYWGFKTGTGTLLKIMLGIGLPLLVSVVWASFGAPGASRQPHGVWHLLLEVVIFGSGVVALFAAGKPSLAWVFGLVIVVNRVLMFAWKQ
jgi:hypothetical protein